MYLLIEVSEFASGIAEEELALDPDGEAEQVGKKQSAIDRDALEVAVQDEAAATAPGNASWCMSQKPSARKTRVATKTALASMGLRISGDRVDRRDALPDPAHDGHRHAVAERFVTGAIRGRLAAILDQGVIVRGKP